MIMLPPVREGAAATGRLSGTGNVVRVTNSDGFAVAVTFHLVKPEELATSQRFQLI
jgi:hypothetical protein